LMVGLPCSDCFLEKRTTLEQGLGRKTEGKSTALP
jgi:hypothetical protein